VACRCCSAPPNPGGELPTGASTGQIIFWDDVLGAWIVNSAVPPGVNDVLVWDGSTWVPSSTSGLAPGTDVGDVLQWNGVDWVSNAAGAPSVGDFLLFDGTIWQPTPGAYFAISVVGGAGSLVANGLGTAQNVVLATIAAGDTIIISRTVDGGAPGIAPLIVITPATGFSLTFSVGDTSTYAWRVIR